MTLAQQILNGSKVLLVELRMLPKLVSAILSAAISKPLGDGQLYEPGECDEIRSGFLCSHVRESRKDSVRRRVNPRLVLCGQL